MVNLMQSPNHPSQRQPEPQYKANPYPVGIPHSLIATLYEGSVRNFQSNPVSSDIMSKSKSATTREHIDLSNVNDLGRYFKPYSDHLLEDKRVDDYHSWTGNRVSKYTACSNIIANEISHLYKRDDLNFEDWQYLLLYNKFKKILSERGSSTPETITYLIYNLINMVKSDLTLRNLLMISSDEYVEEVLTKFVEMALNQRIFGYEFSKPNVDSQKMKSSRKHLQRSTAAASAANSVSKAWGWKDSQCPYPIQAPSHLKPENFFVFGRHLRGSDENINIKDGCIPVPRVVYRNNDVNINMKSPYSRDAPLMCNTPYGNIFPHDMPYSCDTRLSPNASLMDNALNEPSASTEPEKKKNSKRYGPRGPYKRTLIRMRMREISRMRRHIKNKATESFFLNSEFDNSVKDLKAHIEDNNNKGDDPMASDEMSEKIREGELEHINEVKSTIHEVSVMTTRSKTSLSRKVSESIEPTDNDSAVAIPDPVIPNVPAEVVPEITSFKPGEMRRDPNVVSNIEKSRMFDKKSDLTKGGEWVPQPTSKMYAYYTSIHEGYIDPHLIYSSNASTNNSISSSPIANDYFNDSQSTRLNSEATSEDVNYQEITYGINRPLNIHDIRNKEFVYCDPTKRDIPIYTEKLEFRPLYNPLSQDQVVDFLNTEKEAQPIKKFTNDEPFHSMAIPETIIERRSTRSGNISKKFNAGAKIIDSDYEIGVKKGATKPKQIGIVSAFNDEHLNERQESVCNKFEHKLPVNGIKEIKKYKRINGIHKDKLSINDLKNKDVAIEKSNFECVCNGSDKIAEINEGENENVANIDIDVNEKLVPIATGKGKVDDSVVIGKDSEEINLIDDLDVEGKRKEEHTIWDMVQKHHKSIHAATPIVVKNSNSYNNEAADEKDDMSLLIREHYHISENVPSSQTLPFPNAYKNPKCVKWSYSETKRFYNAIETFGTDLLMVRAFMPEFTDRQVYDKFKLEERKNPQLMQNALQTHKSISLKQYEQKHGKIDTKTHYNPLTDPLLQGEAVTTKSGLQLNPEAAEHLDTDSQPKVDDKIINLFM